MFDAAVSVNLSALENFRRGFSPESHKAMVRAFKGGGFWLKSKVSEALIRGVGPQKAPLTQFEAKFPGKNALSVFGTRRFVAYEVRPDPDNITATIGFSQFITRAPTKKKSRKRTIVNMLAGGPHEITRREQANMAYRIRKKLGEPVKRKGDSGFVAGGVRKPARYDWANIRIMLPPLGAVVDWPERDVYTQVVKDERERALRLIKQLYEIKLAKKRWASGAFWEKGAEFKWLTV